MNKNEVFINKLIEMTDDGKLNWIPLPVHMHSDLIFNSDHNIRLFEAKIKKKKILLAEKKVPEYFTDFDMNFETSHVEIYIVSDVGVESVIDSDIASKDTLWEFINTVSRKANKIDDFLNDIIDM
jgi:hypothetical protein